MLRYGYTRICSAVPNVRPGDVRFNVSQILNLYRKAEQNGADVMVTPELGVTGYTCADLFNQTLLQQSSDKALRELAIATKDCGCMLVVGAPVVAFDKRFNCAIVLSDGKISGIVPKTHLPNYGEFYEKRWFESGFGINGVSINFAGENVAFGTDLIFEKSGVKIGIEICEDLWVPLPPSSSMSRAGVEIILNLSASDELIGKHDYMLNLVAQQSARCRCAYVYSSAGWGESSTDLVFAGNAVIAADGSILASSRRFFLEEAFVIKDVDIEKLENDRLKYSTFSDGEHIPTEYRIVPVNTEVENGLEYANVTVDKMPFVPADKNKLAEHCEEIINIQARGLMQRLNVIKCHDAVIGISGGLDSTLALLVTVRAFDLLGLDRRGIIGITMPGEATTSRTHNNAVGLMEELGITVLEIPIGKAVAQHFADIDQDPDRYDVTYENSQARERTQILMDYANKSNAIVIGTGDMSELALGWCTYNGDHMSMYGVNASVPKTLVRHLVTWFSEEFGGRVSDILKDIVDTPISPELVPSGSDTISQKTEDLVGPYELHDFFMYHLLRNSFTPAKIYWLACEGFKGIYDKEVVLKWLRNFYRRFFNQQFKRSCMPDGPKVGSVCLSPRGDWRMPSDASSALWLNEIDRLSTKE